MPLERPLTGVERFFGEDEVIVSKTDVSGKITYTNRVFIRISGYSENELLGAPHSLIRHPAMPRCVFKLLWDTVEAGRECFAYVVNRAKTGDHYWVFAHVTPSFDDRGRIIGYHSNRRAPDRDIVENAIIPLYRKLLDEEKRHGDRQKGLGASYAMMANHLKSAGVGYDEWIFALSA